MKTISSENNKFYLEFQQILNSKLDRHKSGLELEIRKINEEMQKTIAGDINPKIVEVEKKLNTGFLELNKKIRGLYIVGSISILMII